MTKKTTKKNKRIIWRLKEQPTTESLSKLVKEGILDKNEARQILFSEDSKEDRDIKSLEKEIEFLKMLIDKIAQRSQIVTTIKEIERPFYNYPWFEFYYDWCDSSSTSSFFKDIMTF
jgi:hypothetical protein